MKQGLTNIDIIDLQIKKKKRKKFKNVYIQQGLLFFNNFQLKWFIIL